ncbi:hypothetical protein ACNF49_29040 [Actinomadura sp. ATCC 39365]|uniref:hypothetical protein n=1 Tax=Nonomuraea sp. NPDC005692 TaxID=3157168 RepID=UPI003407FC18
MNVTGTALKTVVLSAAMVVLTSAAAVGAAQAATADVPPSCPSMTSPSNATSAATRAQKAMPNGQTLELRSGNVGGYQYAWARIVNSNDGDAIWVDYSIDSGRNWRQCDLRTISGGRNYGNGLRTSSSQVVCMRAGGRPKGSTVSYLTDWWC